MKVWILNHYAIPPQYGGLNRHFYFSKNLINMNIDTKIFTASKIHNSNKNFMSEQKGLSREIYFEDVKYEFVKTGEYSNNGIKRIFSFIQFPFNLIRCLHRNYKTEKPDIIYASSPELFSTYLSILFARKHKLPILVEIRDLWPESIVEYSNLSRKNIIIKILYRLEEWIYYKADILIFTFEGGKEYIINQKWDINSGGRIDLNKIEYINNGVDLEIFKSSRDSLVDNLLESNKFKVVYTGSIRKVNSIYLLVEAANILKERGIDDIDFIIYGDGTERENLIRKCNELKLENIHFRKHVDKKFIPNILKKADATIIVGQHDSMNRYGMSANKVFDYMAAGKPIISNLDVGYDKIENYNCGIVVPDGKGKEIADAVIKLKDLNYEEYNIMCKNAKLAATHFDYKTLSKKLYEIMIKIRRI